MRTYDKNRPLNIHFLFKSLCNWSEIIFAGFTPLGCHTYIITVGNKFGCPSFQAEMFVRYVTTFYQERSVYVCKQTLYVYTKLTRFFQCFLSTFTFLCEGYPSVARGSPHKGTVMWNIDSFFDVCFKSMLNKKWHRRWFETQRRSCDFNVLCHLVLYITSAYPPNTPPPPAPTPEKSSIIQ